MIFQNCVVVNTFTYIGFEQNTDFPEAGWRKHFFADDQRIIFWLTDDELANMAPIYAEKLNRSKGPVRVLIPMRGWNGVEREGTQFYNPDSYRLFADRLREVLITDIEIREVDCNINDPEFAEAVVKALNKIFRL